MCWQQSEGGSRAVLLRSLQIQAICYSQMGVGEVLGLLLLLLTSHGHNAGRPAGRGACCLTRAHKGGEGCCSMQCRCKLPAA